MYCPHCSEKMTVGRYDGKPYEYCTECEYISPRPLTQVRKSARVPVGRSGRGFSRSRTLTAVRG
jgi:uncharacterized Zn finger protein